MTRLFVILSFIYFVQSIAFAKSECRVCGGPYGIDYYIFGDGCPRNTSQKNVVGREQCGIKTGPLNDPFSGCVTNSANHKVWIGGNNNDILKIGVGNQSFEEASYFRIQDGQGYSCGSDVQSRKNFTMLRYGNHRDLMDIFSVTSNGEIKRYRDRIQDGRHHGIVLGATWIARLYGNNKDIVAAYHIRPDGSVAKDARSFFPGAQIQRIPGEDNAFGVQYLRGFLPGRVKFCVKNGNWVFKDLGTANSYPRGC